MLKTMLFNQTKQNRIRIVEEILLFKAYVDFETRALFLLQQKIGQLFVFVLYVALEKEDFLENSHPVLFCLIEKCSFEYFVCFWTHYIPFSFG